MLIIGNRDNLTTNSHEQNNYGQKKNTFNHKLGLNLSKQNIEVAVNYDSKKTPVAAKYMVIGVFTLLLLFRQKLFLIGTSNATGAVVSA